MSTEEMVRTENHFYEIPIDTKPETNNNEEISKRPKMRDVLQNN